MQKRYQAVALTTVLVLVLGFSYLFLPAYANPGADPTIVPGTIPPWVNTNIEIWSSPPTQGQQNWVRAKVKNIGNLGATGVSVSFYFSQLGAASPNGPGWLYIGTSNPMDIAAGAEVWTNWVPWIPSQSGHHCLQAVINAPQDDNPNNNKAQRNVDVRKAPAGGSMTIRFQVWAPTFNEPGTNIGLNLEHDWPNGTVWHWLPHGPPYDIPINGSVQLELNVELPKNASIKVYTATVTALFGNGTAYGGFGIETHVEAVVGGTWVPVDKINLMAPYVGLTTAILGITIASAAYIKRFKRKKE